MAKKSRQRIHDIGRILCAYPADVNKHMAPYLEVLETGETAAPDEILRWLKRIGPRRRKSRRRA